jgi:hypothetical protein
MHQIDDGPAGHLRQTVSADHGKPRAVHVEQYAVGGHHLHARRLRIDNRLQPTFAARHDFLSRFALSDVLRRADEPFDGARFVESNTALDMQSTDLPVGANDAVFALKRLMVSEGLFDDAVHDLAVFWMNELRKRIE